MEFFKDLIDSFYVTLADNFSINQDVIKVNNNKNIKFFCKNFVNVALEAGWSMKNTEKYNLVLKIAALHLESCFLLITLPNSYLIICIYQI